MRLGRGTNGTFSQSTGCDVCNYDDDVVFFVCHFFFIEINFISIQNNDIMVFLSLLSFECVRWLAVRCVIRCGLLLHIIYMSAVLFLMLARVRCLCCWWVRVFVCVCILGLLHESATIFNDMRNWIFKNI